MTLFYSRWNCLLSLDSLNNLVLVNWLWNPISYFGILFLVGWGFSGRNYIHKIKGAISMNRKLFGFINSESTSYLLTRNIWITYIIVYYYCYVCLLIWSTWVSSPATLEVFHKYSLHMCVLVIVCNFCLTVSPGILSFDLFVGFSR